jgi:7,8-dihydropterin-6-yl-methyl-4-(beta-D-ribofuranosyl)aminobenzene 5'-phosphate synthase
VAGEEVMRLTIVYDNDVYQKGLKGDWGFACLVEAQGKGILFDTGASGRILMENMKALNIDLQVVDDIVLSHCHFDHTGGLSRFLEINPCPVYTPASCRISGADQVISVTGSIGLHGSVFSTGELAGIEQSLAVETPKGVVVVTGCSHCGVERILDRASAHGRVRAIVGGLHGFRNFELIRDLDMICPTHCTMYKAEIQALFPDKYVGGGVGRIIEF